MKYTVDPGLYALGDPKPDSRVFVTANYKMSFDRLRAALPGHNAWILVLDTRGINVWCAAGKGTFGTQELVGRILASALARVVNHRELILPQLSAPGVAAHLVKKHSGFKVTYGPIRAEDIPQFLDAGLKATKQMRLKSFTIRERAILIPVELVSALKAGVIVVPLLFLLGGLGGPGGFWVNALNYGVFAAVSLLTAIAAGAVMTPILLPWLPGRAFSLKGSVLGLFAAWLLTALRTAGPQGWAGVLETTSIFLMVSAVSAYLAMNFTGASTYTSLSGVKKEMRWAMPLEIGAAGMGIALWLGSRFTA